MFGLSKKEKMLKVLKQPVNLVMAGFMCFDANGKQASDEKPCYIQQDEYFFRVYDHTQELKITFQFLAECEEDINDHFINQLFLCGDGFKIVKQVHIKNKTISFIVNFPDNRQMMYMLERAF